MTSSKVPDSTPANPSQEDQAWVKDVLSKHLDAESAQLDYVVSSKLNAARHRAMAQHNELADNKGKPFNWLPAMAGTAAAVVLALLLGQSLLKDNPTELVPSEPQLAASPASLMEDLPILSANDDIEFFQSMEFLEWMDKNSG